jgi:hypothetical protein
MIRESNFPPRNLFVKSPATFEFAVTQPQIIAARLGRAQAGTKERLPSTNEARRLSMT